MENLVNFRLRKNKILDVLKQFNRIDKISKRNETSSLEITIIKDGLLFVIPGVQQNLECDTKGSAKFSIRLSYFLDVIKNENQNILHFELSQNQLTLGKLTVAVLTTFIENDSILRSIDLPLNFTDIDLIKLHLSGKYTKEEIEFNKLKDAIEAAFKKMEYEIHTLTLVLKKYGFTKKEVESLIMKKIESR